MRRALLCCSLIALVSASAFGQTGLGIEAGILFPIGDFGDVAKASPTFGANWEIQDINALGQVAAMSFLARASYAIVQSDVDGADSGGLLELGGGVRAYSTASPLFVGAGAHYANLDPIGGGDSINGWGGYGGLGIRLGPPTLKVDFEGRFNFLVPSEGDNLNYITLVAGLGFPF